MRLAAGTTLFEQQEVQRRSLPNGWPLGTRRLRAEFFARNATNLAPRARQRPNENLGTQSAALQQLHAVTVTGSVHALPDDAHSRWWEWRHPSMMRVHYWQMGEGNTGPPILLLHGFGVGKSIPPSISDLQTWRIQLVVRCAIHRFDLDSALLQAVSTGSDACSTLPSAAIRYGQWTLWVKDAPGRVRQPA